jgi:hypothetical protein
LYSKASGDHPYAARPLKHTKMVSGMTYYSVEQKIYTKNKYSNMNGRALMSSLKPRGRNLKG